MNWRPEYGVSAERIRQIEAGANDAPAYAAARHGLSTRSGRRRLFRRPEYHFDAPILLAPFGRVVDVQFSGRAQALG